MNNATLRMCDCSNKYSQQWSADAYGRLTNRMNEKVLDVVGGDKSNGAQLHLWSRTLADQQWFVDGDHIIYRQSNKSISFDKNRVSLYMWDNHNDPTQRWYFEAVADNPVVKETQQTVTSMEAQCQARFNKIADNDITEMFGGGVYQKLCQITAPASKPVVADLHKDKCQTDKIIQQGSPEQKRKLLGDITRHPDFKNYVHISEVKKMSKIMLEKAINEGKLCSKDITKHPEYKALMKKYAMIDRSSSPPTFKPCGERRKLADVPIESHPDIKKYVKRESVERLKKDIIEMAKKIAHTEQLKSVPSQMSALECQRHFAIKKKNSDK